MPSPYSGADNFPASFNVPSDGDTRNVASVNVGLEALGDRTTWLKNRLGSKWLRAFLTFLSDDSSFPPTLQWTSSTTAGTFTGVTDQTSTAVGVSGIVVPSPGTDLLVLEAAFTVATNDNGAVASAGQFEWQYKIGAGSFTRVPASRLTVRDAGTANIVRDKAVTLLGIVDTSGVGLGAGTYAVQVFGASQSNTLSVNVVGGITVRVSQLGIA